MNIEELILFGYKFHWDHDEHGRLYKKDCKVYYLSRKQTNRLLNMNFPSCDRDIVIIIAPNGDRIGVSTETPIDIYRERE